MGKLILRFDENTLDLGSEMNTKGKTTQSNVHKSNWASAHITFCFLILDTMWAAASCSCHHDFKARSHIVERGIKINPSFLKLFCQIFGQVMRKQLIYRLMYIKVWSPGSVSTHTILCPSLSFLKWFCSGSNLTSPSTFVLVLSDPICCH